MTTTNFLSLSLSQQKAFAKNVASYRIVNITRERKIKVTGLMEMNGEGEKEMRKNGDYSEIFLEYTVEV